MMRFEDIRAIALERKGPEAFAEGMSRPPIDVSTLPDDRVLAEFTRRIFCAGFNWSVIDKKWPGFEAAFHGFDIGRNAFMSDEELDAHLRDTRIVRHGAKILSVRDNAIFLSDLARDHGSAARFIADWPVTDLVGLFDVLKKRGSRLGGMTGQYGLRFLGKDGFILSKAVTAALNRAGVLDGAATSKSAMRKAQDAFNAWAEESGETYTTMSRVLAMSVPD